MTQDPMGGWGAPPQAQKPESKTKLYVGLGCLAMVLLSCAGCIIWAAIAAPSEEEMAAKKAAEAVERETILTELTPRFELLSTMAGEVESLDDYRGEMFKMLSDAEDNSQSEREFEKKSTKACDTVPDKQVAVMTLESLKSHLIKEDVDENSLTNLFISLKPNSLEEASFSELKALKETLDATSSNRMLLVDVLELTQPEETSGDGFQTGELDAVLFLYDTEKRERLCWTAMHIENSDEIEFGGGTRIGRFGPTVGGTSAEKALREDLDKQIKAGFALALRRLNPTLSALSGDD